MNIQIKIVMLVCVMLMLNSCEKKQANGISQYKKLNSVADFAPALWVKGNTFKGSFSNDYKTFYFFRKIAPETEKYIPYKSDFKNGEWNKPKIMSYYNEKNSYTYQIKVPNKNKLIFTSNKKTEKDTAQNPNYSFWEIELTNIESNKPKELGPKSLLYNYNSQPCITSNGTLYFTSDLPDWSATFSYKMEFNQNTYQEPELFTPVNKWRANKNWAVYEFCVSPNEDYIIVCIASKNENTAADLYISYLQEGEWTYPSKMNNGINTDKTENFPTITNDGKYLLYTSAFSEFKIVPTKLFKSKK